jgi:hypothetical protein
MEGRVDEIAADLMLLTVNDVCVSLFVGDCFPIAGISIKLAGLGSLLRCPQSLKTSKYPETISEII